jgi:hypothetical protein
MKLVQVYDQDGIELGLVDVSECGCGDACFNTVVEEAFNMEDAIEREQYLEEYGIFQTYIDRSIHINLK